MKQHPSKQNIKLAVDNCIFTIKDDQLYILLIQMKKKPFTNMWALPGGLVWQNENTDKAAKRILQEQTNVKDIYLEQLYTFSEIQRDPLGRVVSVAYFALIPSADIKLKTMTKYYDVKWYKYDQLPKLAYDHNQIANYAKQRLEWKIKYTNIVWSLLPEKFTFTQLQKVYEAILDKKLDKRNFRKKILSLKLLKKAGQTEMKGAHRPAELYQFKTRQTKYVDIL